MNNYVVYMPHQGTHHVNVYVCELDPAVICQRLCEGREVKIRTIRDPLILRYWKLTKHRVNYTGKRVNGVFQGNSAGHKVAKEAYEFIRRLNDGIEFREPTFEKKGRSEHGRARQKENLPEPGESTLALDSE